MGILPVKILNWILRTPERRKTRKTQIIDEVADAAGNSPEGLAAEVGK